MDLSNGPLKWTSQMDLSSLLYLNHKKLVTTKSSFVDMELNLKQKELTHDRLQSLILGP